LILTLNIINAGQDALKSVTDGLIADQKDKKKTVRYTTVEQIDAAIAKLRKQQETTTMSLGAEKNLVKVSEVSQQPVSLSSHTMIREGVRCPVLTTSFIRSAFV